jgi:RimJ/RimL family protein N-acetyltransferase
LGHAVNEKVAGAWENGYTALMQTIELINDRDPFQGFTTERLIVRAWVDGDLADLIAGVGDFEVARWTTIPHPYGDKEGREFLARVVGKNHRDHSFFAAVDKASGKLIGGTDVKINAQGAVDGGIWIGTPFHGQGFGTELWRARAQFAFSVLGVDYLVSGFLEGNEKSRRMQEKVGFKLTGERRPFHKSRSRTEPITEVVMRLDKKDLK